MDEQELLRLLSDSFDETSVRLAQLFIKKDGGHYELALYAIGLQTGVILRRFTEIMEREAN